MKFEPIVVVAAAFAVLLGVLSRNTSPPVTVRGSIAPAPSPAIASSAPAGGPARSFFADQPVNAAPAAPPVSSPSPASRPPASRPAVFPEPTRVYIKIADARLRSAPNRKAKTID